MSLLAAVPDVEYELGPLLPAGVIGLKAGGHSVKRCTRNAVPLCFRPERGEKARRAGIRRLRRRRADSGNDRKHERDDEPWPP